MTSKDPVLSEFEDQLADHPARPIVVSPLRRAAVCDVDALARRIAGFLPDSCAGRAVGLAAANGPAFLAGWVAVRRAGGVPLLLDAAGPGLARVAAARSLGAIGVLTAGDGWAPVGDWEWTPLEPTAVELPADTALVKLTSGSTGAPRGIAVSARAVAADDDHLTRTMELAATERALAAVALSHSYGFSSLALPALRRGVALVVAEVGGPLAPLAAAETCGATFFPAVPAWLSAWARLAEPPPWPASLTRVISAGAPLSAETASLFHRRSSRYAHVFYGASECGGITYDRRGDAALRGTVGTPVDGVEIALRADGRPAVRSAAVAIGAIPAADLDLASGTFVAGDLAAWDGDELRLLGRADDLVIIRGKNVDPREVEAVLRALDAVDDVAVLGVDSGRPGEPTLRAVIACAPGALAYENVARHCRERLAEHKVPRSIVFVDALPRTARGKLDRQALLALTA